MDLIVETFLSSGEASSAKRRVRPLPGQGVSTAVRVECSRAMRMACPVGQRFLLAVQWKSKEGGPDFLYSNHRDSWHPVSDEEAERFILQMFGRGAGSGRPI